MTRSLCLLVLCLSSLAIDIQAQETKTSRTHGSTVESPRVEMSLRGGWRFKLGPQSATELQAEPDATWTTISVPHTWNRVGEHPLSEVDIAGFSGRFESAEGPAIFFGDQGRIRVKFVENGPSLPLVYLGDGAERQPQLPEILFCGKRDAKFRAVAWIVSGLPTNHSEQQNC